MGRSRDDVSGRPVRRRTVEYDLRFLIAVLRWATQTRDEDGRGTSDRQPPALSAQGCDPVRRNSDLGRSGGQPNWMTRISEGQQRTGERLQPRLAASVANGTSLALPTSRVSGSVDEFLPHKGAQCPDT